MTRTRYGIAQLLALLLGVIPAAILPDLIVPIPGSAELSPAMNEKGGTPGFPPYLTREIAVFKWLTVPPSMAGEVIGLSRTEYARLVAADGFIGEAWPALPPGYFAVQHLSRALPFWTLLMVAIGELVAFFRRKRTPIPS